MEIKMTIGYFEIGVYHPKTEINVGTLWRSAFQLGAQGIFTIGHRYKRQASDTANVMLQIPLRHYDSFDEFSKSLPMQASLIAVEMGGRKLENFVHPKQAIYLLGAEDYGLPQEILDKCRLVVSIGSMRTFSYNVAVAGSIVMYSRFQQESSI